MLHSNKAQWGYSRGERICKNDFFGGGLFKGGLFRGGGLLEYLQYCGVVVMRLFQI